MKRSTQSIAAPRTARPIVFLLGTSLVGVITMVASCSDPSSGSEDATRSTTAQGLADAGVDPSGATGVDCTHPGAGKSLAGGRCECTTSRNVAGDWSTLRTCSEGDRCPTKDKADTVVITQNGIAIRAERGGTYSLTGTICGDVAIWNGGPSDGLNPECGTIRFTDDFHYMIDSCYAGSGECVRSHGQGCPDQKGQCTGTGAKKPESAPLIRKIVCN